MFSRSGHFASVFALLCLAALLTFAAPLASAQQRKFDPDVEKILRERVTVLREAADLLMDFYKGGRTTLERVTLAERAVIEAELELAPNKAERIGHLEKLVENVTRIEKMVAQQVEHGVASTLDLKLATAHRLRAQADLMLAQKSAAQ